MPPTARGQTWLLPTLAGVNCAKHWEESIEQYRGLDEEEDYSIIKSNAGIVKIITVNYIVVLYTVYVLPCTFVVHNKTLGH